MRAEPFLVAGSDRCCTAVMQAAPGIIAKVGAEGVYLGAVQGHGLGVALKAEDGAGRAAEAAFIALLDHLGTLDEGARAALAGHARPVLRNYAGIEVGRVAPVAGWPAV